MSVEVGRKVVVVTNVDWMGHFARVPYCRARSGIYPKGDRIGQWAWCCQTKVENTTKRRYIYFISVDVDFAVKTQSDFRGMSIIDIELGRVQLKGVFYSGSTCNIIARESAGHGSQIRFFFFFFFQEGTVTNSAI